MHKEFSVFEALSIGAQRAFDNFRLFFLAGLTFIGITALSAVVIVLLAFQASGVSLTKLEALKNINTDSLELQQLISVVTTHALYLLGLVFIIMVIAMALVLGYNKMALEVYDRGTSTVSKIFSCFSYVPTALVAGLLYALMVSVGMLLFVVPGIYIALRCGFFIYFIIDKDAGILESLKLSYAVTQGHMWQIFALYTILTSVTLVLPILGLFIMPISACAWSYVYRRLTAPEITLDNRDVRASV